MKATRFVIFLIIAITCTSACRNNHTEGVSQYENKREVLTSELAMTMLSGTYDSKAQYSIAPAATNIYRWEETKSENAIVRPLFNDFSEQNSNQEAILVTYAVPQDEPFDCHACHPTIGVAVFSRQGQNWRILASNKAVTSAGRFGKPPRDIVVIQIGPKQKAVQIKDSDEGGQATTVLLLLAPWNGSVNLSLERIIADDDDGMCGPGGVLVCYSNHRSIAFVPNLNGDYYDLELKLAGTDISPATRPAKVRKVSGIEKLQFRDGKYIQLSRIGDLTSLDRIVAERENLK